MMAALRTLRAGAPTRRIGVSPVSDLARRRASLPTDAGRVGQLPNCRRSRSWPETRLWEVEVKGMFPVRVVIVGQFCGAICVQFIRRTRQLIQTQCFDFRKASRIESLGDFFWKGNCQVLNSAAAITVASGAWAQDSPP